MVLGPLDMIAASSLHGLVLAGLGLERVNQDVCRLHT